MPPDGHGASRRRSRFALFFVVVIVVKTVLVCAAFGRNLPAAAFVKANWAKIANTVSAEIPKDRTARAHIR